MLPPELEAQLPEQLRLVRQFYLQLPEEEKRKLNKIGDNSKEIEFNTKKNNKFCYECGQKIQRSAEFCENCGVKQPKLEQ